MDQVFFRLPQKENIHHWTGTFTEKEEEIPIQENQKAFVFGRFNSQNKAFLLNPIETKEHTLSSLRETIKLPEAELLGSDEGKSKADYINLIEKSISWLQENDEAGKVVLARSESKNISIEPIQSFISFCKKFPSALITLVLSEKHGYWLGASPEIFIQQTETEIATYSLAGTRKANTKVQNWGRKEQEEQALVTKYIVETLTNLGIKFKANKSETLTIGNLEHILTQIEIPINQKNKINALIKFLNPTPAVCGLPKEKALRFIQTEEGLHRNFYAGLIGPIFSSSKFSLYVNLRCLQFDKTKIKQYAGGGITANSISELEWEETENKSQTLLRLL